MTQRNILIQCLLLSVTAAFATASNLMAIFTGDGFIDSSIWTGRIVDNVSNIAPDTQCAAVSKSYMNVNAFRFDSDAMICTLGNLDFVTVDPTDTGIVSNKVKR